MDKSWLDQCREEDMPIPPFDHYIYMLSEHVVKKRLMQGEVGYDGYIPRNENEIKATELVREYTNIPVPELVHRGEGFNVFQRISGITVNEGPAWDEISPRQREGLKFQVQRFIEQLSKIPNSTGGVRSLTRSGEVIHDQLPHRGPFDSTENFLKVYAKEDVPLIHQVDSLSKPVFSHLDWDLSNIVLHPNFDAVAGLIDWKRASFFPEGGRSIHQMCHQWEGWETLFDGLEFPKDDSPQFTTEVTRSQSKQLAN